MRRFPGRGRRGRIALIAAAALLLLAVLAQLLLPGLAAERISARVGRYGRVLSVHVSASPPVELLWHHADAVTVRAGELSLSPAQAAALLWEARGAARVDLSAARLRIGPLQLERATLRKRGRALSAEALVTGAQVRAALPAGVEVRLLGSGGGRVTVAVTGGLFGLRASVRAAAQASGGRLVVRPLGFPLEGLALTLFADRHVHVESLGASVVDRAPLTYRLRIAATLG